MAAALSLTLGAGLPAGSSDLAVGIHGAPGKPGGEACERTGVSTASDPTGNPPRTSTSVAVVGSCRGVRPGAVVRTQRGVCTLNFVFAASDRRRYVATAGHCVLGTSAMLEDIGERRWAVSRGPVARDREGRRIGEFAYAVLAGPKDFAVIRLDRGVAADPRVCYVGGPTGINADRSTRRLLTFRYVGNAVGVGQVLPSRTATAYGMPDADLLYATGVAAWGDSGGPVLSSDGRAVGVVSGVGLNAREVGTEAVHAGTVRVTRLLPQLRRAERVLGIRLRLHTAHR